MTDETTAAGVIVLSAIGAVAGGLALVAAIYGQTLLAAVLSTPLIYAVVVAAAKSLRAIGRRLLATEGSR